LTSRFSEKIQQRMPAIMADFAMVVIAWWGAYWLRFNLDQIPEQYFHRALQVMPLVVLVQMACFHWFGVFRGVWRFSSLPDVVRILKSVAVGVGVSVAVLFLVVRLEDIPRTVPLFYGLLLVAFLTGPRVLYRWLKEHRLTGSAGKRVLVVGAGEAGEMLVRDLLRKGRQGFHPVAFVDDRVRRHGQEVHGLPVVGGCEDIPAVTDRLEIDLILLAIPSSSASEMRRIVGFCEQAGAPFRTVPNLEALVSGRISVNELREVSIEDILGREPVSLDWEAINKGLRDRTILVTGSGGSIGSELCRQVARLGPARLVLFENSEYNLYRIELELRKRSPQVKLEVRLGDVTDAAAVERLFEECRPDVVFHAAAYKHVPMLEHQIRQAVRNNVLGTRTVALAADRFGCREFVLISTDKAVNPANIMGTTKRFAEIFCQNLNARSDTCYITVRFGNVLGSAGSVVPLFREQIAAGGPVTVTHPDMERYFMTIPEACQLIMQAAVIGKGGEIFVLNMGEPVKICFLAEQMIRLSGKEPGVDMEIHYTGLRPGEKLYEELFHEQEALEPTDHEKILLARHRKVDWNALAAAMEDIEQSCAIYDDAGLMRRLTEFVPENRIGQG
jgi:FlaA1/EpsC-like NDP-sugar epimerase